MPSHSTLMCQRSFRKQEFSDSGAPQFDPENLKKSCASPRLDESRGYHRGRRQSEPPELLLYTPEKSRKSLPLLLEGNLPYRRTRRQSAPAKDIEAIFHPNALKQAGSEGELCQADSLGSAGSNSTLASSVIEVEAERTEPSLTPQLQPNREEEEEEDAEELTPLSPLPTLSITEEILEFINQSRAREGLTAIHTGPTEQALDEPKEGQPPSNQTNFTCPLPPVSCPSSPQQKPTIQQEQERAELEDSNLQGQTGASGEENDLENEVQELPDATSEVEKGVEEDGGSQEEVLEKEKEEEKTGDEGEGDSSISVATPDLRPSISEEEEERENSSSCLSQREEVNPEATTSSPNPELPHHPIPRFQPPTRGSHLTKRDKKIIEKIRSYYEAAAEAEENEAEEEGEQGEGVASRRRNSFSQIPSGLVKESVSRFDVNGPQGVPEIGQSNYETTEAFDQETDQETEPCSPIGPISSPTLPSADAENDGRVDEPISSLDFDVEDPTSPTSSVIQDKETSNKVGLNLESYPNRPVGQEAEIQDMNGKVCKEVLEEKQEVETRVVASEENGGNAPQGEGPSVTKQSECRDEIIQTNAGNQAVMNRHQPNPAEPYGSHKEPPTPLPPTEQCQITETKTDSTWTRTKHRDLARTSGTSGNLEGLPSQIKVGRWSRHSRIVTANRVLFEGMGSDVAGIGLFEATPVVDPMLMENSDRILSKVQTLARMYSAKASTMKVPLHQKRASAVWNQTWDYSKLSGPSSQTQTESQAQVQSLTQLHTPTKYQQQKQYHMEVNQSHTHSKSKYETKTHSETKVQSQTITQTRQQSQIQTKTQNQTKTYSQYQTQTMSREDQTTQEKRMMKRAESLTNDFQEEVLAPVEPLLFGHVFVKEQLAPDCPYQTNGFTLSRPRDFISALTKERDSIVGCISGDNNQSSTRPGESLPTSPRDPSSSQAPANNYNPGYTSTDTSTASTALWHHLRAQPEEPSSSLGFSSSNSPLTSAMNSDCRVTEFRDYCSNREVHSQTEEREKREGSEELSDLCGPVYSVREESTSINIITPPAHSEPNISDHSIPQWGISKDGYEQDQYEQDIAAAQCIQDRPAPEYKMPTGHTDNKDESVCLVCPGPVDGEATPGELVLMVANTESQAPTEYLKSTKPGLGVDQSQRETLYQAEGGATVLGSSGGPQKDEPPSVQMKVNETKYNSSSQTRMILQGSAVIFTEETPYFRSSGELVATPEDHKASAPSPLSSVQNSESNPTRPLVPSVPSADCLPTFTSQRPQDLPTAMGKRALSNTSCREPGQQDSQSPTSLPLSGRPAGSRPSSRPSLETSNLVERPYQAIAAPGQNTDQTSAFRPSLRHCSPSPVGALPFTPPCSSPFRVISASSPTPVSAEDASLNTVSGTLPCFSPTPSSGRGSLLRARPASPSTPSSPFTPSSSSSGRSSSIRAGPPSSPTPSSSSLRSPPCTSPIASSSAFTRSLAASCISQSIIQSMAKKNNALQQAPPINTVNQSPSSTSSLPSSHLQRRSPSPKLPPSQQGSSTPAYAQLGCAKDGYQHPRGPPSSLWSCPSPMQSPPPSFSQRSPSPSMTLTNHQPSSPSPRPSFLHSKTNSSQNANNNNNNSSVGINAANSNASNTSSCSLYRAVSNGGWSGSPQKALLANGSTNTTAMQQTPDPLWSGSHNRVARPFSASEPSSRVQSPSPSPTLASFTRLCSPPPQHNYSSPMANKPPHPRSTRVGGASSHNPLGLTLELPRTSSASSAFGLSSSCLSPRILSPPPIGVSVNAWTNNVAAPQPRNPRYASASPSLSFSSSLGSPTLENASFPTSISSLRSSRASSPSATCPPATSQTLRRSFSSNLADRSPSPARSNPSGLRRSWADGNRRSVGFSGSGRGSFDQQESCPTSPRSGWSSYGSSPSCLSPRAGLQSPLSPGRLTPGKGTLGGQHFTSVPWPDVRELSNKYNGTDSLDSSGTSTIIASPPAPLSSLSHTLLSSPVPSDKQTEWGDPELEEGNCRSQLICAYVARPSCVQNLSSSCMVLSSSGMTSPPPACYQHHNFQSTMPPLPSNPSPLPLSSSPLPFAHSSPTKQGNQKTSYATTVNLQIAGSGRITSFSTAQVSLTQTMQGGAEARGPGQGQMTRRVSINGLSHLPSPLPQSCNRL